jgi:hypothetical protein
MAQASRATGGNRLCKIISACAFNSLTQPSLPLVQLRSRIGDTSWRFLRPAASDAMLLRPARLAMLEWIVRLSDGPACCWNALVAVGAIVAD